MIRLISFIGFLVTWHLGIASDLVISNARIIDGTGRVIQQGSVVVSDARIVSVMEGNHEAEGVRLDARGMTVMPGLIDTHWHLLAGSGAASDQAVDRHIDEVVTAVLDSLLRRGVTTIMSPGDHFPNILELRRRLAEGDMRGPRLLVVGPVFTSPDDWPTQLCQGDPACKAKLTVELTSPEQARREVRALAAAGVDAVKLVYDDIIAPDVRIDDEVVAAIAEEARANDLVLYAHISTVDETAMTVVGLGARGLVHPVPLRANADGSGARRLRDLQVPVSTTISFRTKEWYELTGREYTEDADASFRRTLEDIKHLWDAGVTLAFGTDSVASSSPLALVEGQFLAEARALNQVLSNEEVITTLTRNAAVYLGLGDELGTLEPGKLADIILIDGDPLDDLDDLTRVKVVVQHGQIVVDNR